MGSTTNRLNNPTNAATAMIASIGWILLLNISYLLFYSKVLHRLCEFVNSLLQISLAHAGPEDRMALATAARSSYLGIRRIGLQAVFRRVQPFQFFLSGCPNAHSVFQGKEQRKTGTQGPSQNHAHAYQL